MTGAEIAVVFVVVLVFVDVVLSLSFFPSRFLAFSVDILETFLSIISAASQPILAAVPAPINCSHSFVGTGIIGIDHKAFLAILSSFQSHTGVPLKTIVMTLIRISHVAAAPNILIKNHQKISLVHDCTSRPNALCCTSANHAISYEPFGLASVGLFELILNDLQIV